MRLSLRSHGMKELMIGDENQAIRPQMNLSVGEDHAMAGFKVVVETPKWTEDILIVPIGTPREKARFVDGYVQSEGLGAEGLKIHALTGEGTGIRAQR